MFPSFVVTLCPAAARDRTRKQASPTTRRDGCLGIFIGQFSVMLANSPLRVQNITTMEVEECSRSLPRLRTGLQGRAKCLLTSIAFHDRLPFSGWRTLSPARHPQSFLVFVAENEQAGDAEPISTELEKQSQNIIENKGPGVGKAVAWRGESRENYRQMATDIKSVRGLSSPPNPQVLVVS